jgi:hypothetical protein
MSALSSTSTDAQVWAAYDDNASFEEDSAPAKAAAFITACRILLRRRPVNMTVDGRTLAFDAQAITGELERARNWLAMNRSPGAIRYLDFSGVRD